MEEIKLIEKKITLMMNIFLTEKGEIEPKKRVGITKILLNRHGEINFGLIRKLVDDYLPGRNDFMESCDFLNQRLSLIDKYLLYSELVSLIFIDEVWESELDRLQEASWNWGLDRRAAKTIFNIFEEQENFQAIDDDYTLTFGRPELNVDVPVRGFKGFLFFVLVDDRRADDFKANSFIAAIVKSGEVDINDDHFPYGRAIKFDQSHFLSFCDNLYFFDYWHIRSLFLNKRTLVKPQKLWLYERSNFLSLSNCQKDNHLAEIDYLRNEAVVRPKVDLDTITGEHLAAGREYRLFAGEHIYVPDRGVVSLADKRCYSSTLNEEESGREINLRDFDPFMGKAVLTVTRKGDQNLIQIKDSPHPIKCDMDLYKEPQITGLRFNRAPVKNPSAKKTENSEKDLFKGLYVMENPAEKITIDKLSLTIKKKPGESGGLIKIKANRIVDIEGVDLSTAYGKRKVLHGVSFKVNSGDLVAIMGPSGSGKTTMLKTILGIQPLTGGEVRINGLPRSTGLRSLREKLGYVPQDDLINGSLTVYENVYYALRVKKPEETIGREQLKQRVNQALDMVRLSETTRHKLVGPPEKQNLSGGERKRVNIAMELVCDPDVLVLDEPTSGLSSHDAANIVRILRYISDQGKIVMLVIHQPSSQIYRMFDKTLLLGKGGHQAYFGNNSQALTVFSKWVESEATTCPICKMNPDILMEAMPPEPTEFEQTSMAGIRKLFSLSSLPGTKKRHPYSKKLNPVDRTREFCYQLKRQFVCKIRDPINLLITLLISPLLGFVIGYTLRDSGGQPYLFSANEHYPKLLFLLAIASLFFGFSSSITEIIKDRLLLKREKLSRISQVLYLIAKYIVVAIFAVLQCALFALTAHFGIGMMIMLPFNLFCMIITAVSAIGIGLFFSSFTPTITAAYNLVPVLLLPQIVLGGLFVSFDQINPLLRPSDDLKANIAPFYVAGVQARWGYEMMVAGHYFYHPHEKLLAEKDNYYRLKQAKKISSAEYRKKTKEIGDQIDIIGNFYYNGEKGAFNDALFDLMDDANQSKGEFLAPNTRWFFDQGGDYFPTWRYDAAILLGMNLFFGLLTLVALKTRKS